MLPFPTEFRTRSSTASSAATALTLQPGKRSSASSLTRPGWTRGRWTAGYTLPSTAGQGEKKHTEKNDFFVFLGKLTQSTVLFWRVKCSRCCYTCQSSFVLFESNTDKFFYIIFFVVICRSNYLVFRKKHNSLCVKRTQGLPPHPLLQGRPLSGRPAGLRRRRLLRDGGQDGGGGNRSQGGVEEEEGGDALKDIRMVKGSCSN